MITTINRRFGGEDQMPKKQESFLMIHMSGKTLVNLLLLEFSAGIELQGKENRSSQQG